MNDETGAIMPEQDNVRLALLALGGCPKCNNPFGRDKRTGNMQLTCCQATYCPFCGKPHTRVCPHLTARCRGGLWSIPGIIESIYKCPLPERLRLQIPELPISEGRLKRLCGRWLPLLQKIYGERLSGCADRNERIRVLIKELIKPEARHEYYDKGRNHRYLYLRDPRKTRGMIRTALKRLMQAIARVEREVPAHAEWFERAIPIQRADYGDEIWMDARPGTGGYAFFKTSNRVYDAENKESHAQTDLTIFALEGEAAGQQAAQMTFRMLDFRDACLTDKGAHFVALAEAQRSDYPRQTEWWRRSGLRSAVRLYADRLTGRYINSNLFETMQNLYFNGITHPKSWGENRFPCADGRLTLTAQRDHGFFSWKVTLQAESGATKTLNFLNGVDFVAATRDSSIFITLSRDRIAVWRIPERLLAKIGDSLPHASN